MWVWLLVSRFLVFLFLHSRLLLLGCCRCCKDWDTYKKIQCQSKDWIKSNKTKTIFLHSIIISSLKGSPTLSLLSDTRYAVLEYNIFHVSNRIIIVWWQIFTAGDVIWVRQKQLCTAWCMVDIKIGDLC